MYCYIFFFLILYHEEFLADGHLFSPYEISHNSMQYNPSPEADKFRLDMTYNASYKSRIRYNMIICRLS